MSCPRENRERAEELLVCSRGVLARSSAGRLRPEPECELRTCFQRDIDRIIHCKSFRRLKHKTQVFLQPEGDHYRTRLTHTLEVARIARTISRALMLNEDLTEAIALGHDLGHTPFGHAGERALNEIYPGGFRHYEQSLRVVDRLEKDGRGLNLCEETRTGILNHTTGQPRRAKLTRPMCAQGCNEISTLAFYADADLVGLHIAADAAERNVIRLLNPITSNLTIMRPLLAPSMLNTVVENLKKGNNAGRIFELSNIYVPKAQPVTELPDEIPHLGLAAFGDDEDFFTVKGTMEALADAFGLEFDYERAEDVPYLHPGIAAYVLCGGKRVGVFGKLANEVTAELKLPKDSKANHKIFLGELDWQALEAAMPEGMRYRPIPEFATVTRDLALVVEENMPCGTLTAEIRKACKQVGDVELFDIYRGEQVGEGKKSMAFKISFVPTDKALTPKDLDRFMNKILGNLKHKLGIDLR